LAVGWKGFLVHAEPQSRRAAEPQSRRAAEEFRSLGVIAPVAVIPAIPFRRLSLQTYTQNAVFL
jgi:hypothetical protein